MNKIFVIIISLLFTVNFMFAQEIKHATPKVRVTPSNISAKEKQNIGLYKKVVQSVVTIQTVSDKYTERGTNKSQGLGSGVIISGECHILTAAHVVDGAKEIYVKTNDGKLREASILFSEKTADIALLKLKVHDANLAHAKFGNSDALAIGQQVYAIGSPYGLENSFSTGIISAFRNFNTLYDGTVGVEFIQTDAAINSGNSGGPIFNSSGEVIGIASSILTVSGGFQGIGMVVAINTAKDLLSFEGRPWIGIEGNLLTSENFKEIFNLDIPGGILVQKVAKSSPAEKAGIRGGNIYAKINNREVLLGGDIILQIGSQVTCHTDCLIHSKNELNTKDKLEIRYLRNGKEYLTTVDISEVRKNFLALD
ncbi:PDZ domain-containing protein [Flavobacteriaceae bacterium AU392]|nr:PDZ domain-containing protein [Flavobacteriaceae bacterium]RKM85456.1 PDZ domain-containing protein [Flavobacteriaceae bacterium AU392]